jgi:hypothetical protein
VSAGGTDMCSMLGRERLSWRGAWRSSNDARHHGGIDPMKREVDQKDCERYDRHLNLRRCRGGEQFFALGGETDAIRIDTSSASKALKGERVRAPPEKENANDDRRQAATETVVRVSRQRRRKWVCSCGDPCKAAHFSAAHHPGRVMPVGRSDAHQFANESSFIRRSQCLAKC